MIKVYSGEDSFESYNSSKKASDELANSKNLKVKILECDQYKSVDSFLAEVETIGMFSEESIIYAKRFLDNKKLAEYLETHFESLNKYEIIIWHDKKPDGRLKIFKSLKTKGLLEDYKALNERDLATWTKSLLNTKKINLNSEQINYLNLSLDLNKWLISSEIEKLSLYLHLSNATSLSNEQLEKLLGFDVKGNIWKFLDFFGNREKSKLVKEFNKLVAFENNTQMIIAMISREIDLLLQVKFAEDNRIDPKELGLHPFVVNKTRSKVRNFNKNDLLNLSRKLFDLDFAIKTGRIDEEVGMSLYLMSV